MKRSVLCLLLVLCLVLAGCSSAAPAETTAPAQAQAPAVTTAPAEGLGLAGKGRLAPGGDGDVLLTDRDLRPVQVFAGGRCLWQAE